MPKLIGFTKYKFATRTRLTLFSNKPIPTEKCKAQIQFVRIRVRVRIRQNSITLIISLEVIP